MSARIFVALFRFVAWGSPPLAHLFALWLLHRENKRAWQQHGLEE